MPGWINKYRLFNQKLAKNSSFKSPGEVLKWFCGIQGQDYQAAKHAIAVRVPGLTETDVDEAIANGEIIRTWPMRGTLHFIAAEDVYWLLDLLAPRNKKLFAPRNRQLGLDQKVFNKANDIIIDNLQGNNHLTRDEIKSVLADGGIRIDGVQLSHILNNAALEKIICFGIMRDKKYTFTLLDEWVTVKNVLSYEESLAEVARRYFFSRGPATLQDFIWWSGLTISEARKALSMVSHELTERSISGLSYWFRDTGETFRIKKILLLPAFDEYLISYRDRSSMLDPMFRDKAVYINGVFNPVVVINGSVLGMWKKTLKKNQVIFKPDMFIKITPSQKREIERSAESYSRYLNRNIEVEW